MDHALADVATVSAADGNDAPVAVSVGSRAGNGLTVSQAAQDVGCDYSAGNGFVWHLAGLFGFGCVDALEADASVVDLDRIAVGDCGWAGDVGCC